MSKHLDGEHNSNAFELIEFSLMRNIDGKWVNGTYGVNVAKVREVVRMPEIVPVPSRVVGLAGLFELRGVPIPAINLPKALGDAEAPIDKSQQIIVTEFSRKRAGFIVSSTHRIRRIAWEKVLPPAADAGASMSGMTLIENNRFLFILDLEKILIDLESQVLAMAGGAPQLPGAFSNQAPIAFAPQVTPEPPAHAPGILLVDDSSFIRNSVKATLKRSGYRVITADNGKSAYELLTRYAEGHRDYGKIDVVVSDVEMPQMNGLMLTQKIREHAKLAKMPIILHTSLSGHTNQDAGMKAGANGYVIKNDLHTLAGILRDLLAQEALDASA